MQLPWLSGWTTAPSLVWGTHTLGTILHVQSKDHHLPPNCRVLHRRRNTSHYHENLQRDEQMKLSDINGCRIYHSCNCIDSFTLLFQSYCLVCLFHYSPCPPPRDVEDSTINSQIELFVKKENRKNKGAKRYWSSSQL